MQPLVQRFPIGPQPLSYGKGLVIEKMLNPTVFQLFRVLGNKIGIFLLLLLVGLGQLSAHSQKEKVASVKGIISLEEGYCKAIHNNESSRTKPLVFSAEKQNEQSNVLLCEKEEEEEVMSSKKQLEIGNHSASLWGANALGYFFCSSKKNIPSNTLYSSSNRYLLFQVFRL